jgi:hypothetical protein
VNEYCALLKGKSVWNAANRDMVDENWFCSRGSIGEILFAFELLVNKRRIN